MKNLIWFRNPYHPVTKVTYFFFLSIFMCFQHNLSPAFTQGFALFLSVLLFHVELLVVFEYDIMSTTFDNACAAYHCQLCLFLEFIECEGAAVAHRAFYLCKGDRECVFKRSSIWDIAVNTFYETEFLSSSKVVALPVPCPLGTFSPVLL